jgi:hypothetical protein
MTGAPGWPAAAAAFVSGPFWNYANERPAVPQRERPLALGKQQWPCTLNSRSDACGGAVT